MKAGDIVKRVLSIFVENGKLSIGRCMLLAVFALAIIKWATGVDIPSTMLTFMSALLAYVLSGKLVGTISDTVQKVKGVKDSITTIINNSSETKKETTIVNNSDSKKEEVSKKIPDED